MITKPRGTEDVLPKDSKLWQYIEKTAREVCDLYGYKEIRTPVFEHTELFQRGVGDTTDVVQKEMYTFEDKGGRSITLKPEGTATLVRSYIENSLYANPQPTKLSYIIPCFRYEKPQSGRLREFHQFGIECFGASGASTDAEIISLAWMFLKKLGLSGITLNINSIGCPVCKKEYNQKLRSYFEEYKGELCPTCLERLEKNPMRIIDCKSEICSRIAKDAPKMVDHLCQECSDHFEETKERLSGMGIEFEVNPDIVRGLDYYTKTVFEFVSDCLGAQSTVCGGGRYSGLVEELGGKPADGIGFAAGIERLILVLKAQKGEAAQIDDGPDLFVAAMGDDADKMAQKLIFELRTKGIHAQQDLCGRSLKAQMKYADKLAAKFSIVIGDDEIANNKGNLKNMGTGEVKEISLTADAICEILDGEVK
ncbi:MAG: histidine--tRNA ligase [Clostridia bacterium]|nr:histidine--tRNA ligase [Clostridia bacterium]